VQRNTDLTLQNNSKTCHMPEPLPLDPSVVNIEVVKQARLLLLSFIESPAFSVCTFYHIIKDKKYEDAAGKLQHHKLRQDIQAHGLAYFEPPSNAEYQAKLVALKDYWRTHTITACSGDLLTVVRSQGLEGKAFAFSWKHHQGSASILAINQAVCGRPVEQFLRLNRCWIK
jgi:hypothetical protein